MKVIESQKLILQVMIQFYIVKNVKPINWSNNQFTDKNQRLKNNSSYKKIESKLYKVEILYISRKYSLHLINAWNYIGQAIKGYWWMPWHRQAMKDA